MGIVVKTLAEQTYQWVRGRILSGEMPAGFQVRQDVIATEIGCSKIPLREALTRLEQDGLLSSYPNRGYVVRPMSSSEAMEVFGLRLKLEPNAIASAASRASAEERDAVRQALEVLRESQGRAADYHSAHRSFHLALIRPGGGLVTYQLLERLHILAERYFREPFEQDSQDERSQREHDELAEVWLAGDADRIEGLIRRHVELCIEDMQDELSAATHRVAPRAPVLQA